MVQQKHAGWMSNQVSLARDASRFEERSTATPHERVRQQCDKPTSIPDSESALRPDEVLEIIKAEHANLRRLLSRLESDATSLLACPVPTAEAWRSTRELALRLCAAMAAHVALENRILLPVLTGTDAWGPVRAEQLADEHAQQLQFLHAHADLLASEMTCQALAVASWRLVRTLRDDMAFEEAGVLGGLFTNDGINADVETG